ncbi:hypothetical protein KBB96_19230 [Luteolibacter ambystomatis]|uniref:Uncharacterized protein n=1 Tax=Luteolibacter ambystomatis TaxID=2824561 RepID=A0A975G8Z8_9BACT|nr:hypothetical protein [Luteolibacter ambystomatis]QUE50976.1 hypothetical protein KBB96_19230 [Luteolibacter ambystomatis]
MTDCSTDAILTHVFTAKAPKPQKRPYLDAWLKRTRRQLAPSGRLSEAALILAREEGGSHDSWRLRLRQFLDGAETPSLELLTRIDALLAPVKAKVAVVQGQVALF